MKHELKIEIPYYDAVKSGDMTFEIRFNDRGFQKGDLVKLRAWERDYSCYNTDREHIYVEITYVSSYRQIDGWCVFGFRIIDEKVFER